MNKSDQPKKNQKMRERVRERESARESEAKERRENGTIIIKLKPTQHTNK